MNVMVTGRHMEMTDALRSYIEGGLGKIESHFDKVMDADVVLEVQKHRHIAEVNLHANGVRIHGKEVSADMYASVDAVMEKLERQVRKHKDRINQHKPRGARETRDYLHQIISVVPEEKSVVTSEVFSHRVVHHEKLQMKPLNVEEAVLHIELLDEPFLVFSNAETSQVNVLYRRDDTTYGLIEPQF
jgi:putative sigma-54 modulation protein